MSHYGVDTGRSTVEIGLRVNLHPSHIAATGISGTIECELDADGRPRLDRPYGAEFTLPIVAINSGIKIQDREMRRRFDASRYPTITARLVKGEAVDVEQGRYRATATVTMHGQTREVSGDVTLAFDNGSLTAEAQAVVDMKDFGIDPPRLIVLRVEPDVDIRAHLVATVEKSRE